MAFAKGRGNKRSSSSSSSPASYASTVTIVVFIALCVLGVWMLTSNSIMPPQTTTRTTATTSDRRSTPSFEDNPGELPEDAIKSDENKDSSQEEQTPVIETSNEAEQSNEKTQEAEQENSKIEENQSEIVEENPQELKGKESDSEQEKQKDTQTSDASSVTLNQLPEQNDNQLVTSKETEAETEKNKKQTSNDDSSNNKNQEQNQNNDNKETKSKNSLDTDTQSTAEEKKQIIQQQQEDLKEDSIIDNNTQPQSSSEETQQKTDETTQQKQSDTDKKPTKQSDPNQDTTKESNPDEETTKQTNPNQETKKQTNPNQETKKQTNPDQETTKQSTTKTSDDDKTTTDSKPAVTFPNGENSGIPKESKESKESWSTQADQSENEKERRKDGTLAGNDATIYGFTWQLCNVTAGYDYIPCLDNEKAIKQLRSTKHYEHRERHCPEVGPTCLVPIPEGYKRPIEWPQSRDKIWYHNVPHTKLAEVKGHQNWVKVTGEFLTFPGGGTQFIHGALHYVDFVEQSVPNIAWGKHTRVILDVGCGVASFGGYLFERGVLTMSFAPKDEHEAQVQFALERGIPAISAVMGSQRLPFPSRVFDLIHCARCRVPWHENGGALLLELNRVLRPGGYFVWSATPVYQKLEEDVEIWNAMSSLTVSMCWELVTIQKDQLNSIGAAIYRKPDTNECYDQRKQNRPPMCKNDDDSNAAWYVPLQPCMHRAPTKEDERGSQWPEEWPKRIQTPPYWLNSSQMGIYGKPAPTDFATDYEHWKRVVNNLYFNGLGISWDNVRNVMDMRAVYGGFAAALKDLQVWVFNVVNVDSPDTLPIIYERGMFGIYHDWCESFSTYPRTYDLLHADHLFSRVKKRCKIAPLMAEIDRIVRPGGKLIVRDESSTVGEVENMLKSLHWEVHLTFSKDQEGILSARKSDWRPDTYAVSS